MLDHAGLLGANAVCCVLLVTMLCISNVRDAPITAGIVKDVSIVEGVKSSYSKGGMHQKSDRCRRWLIMC